MLDGCDDFFIMSALIFIFFIIIFIYFIIIFFSFFLGGGALDRNTVLTHVISRAFRDSGTRFNKI